MRNTFITIYMLYVKQSPNDKEIYILKEKKSCTQIKLLSGPLDREDNYVTFLHNCILGQGFQNIFIYNPLRDVTLRPRKNLKYANIFLQSDSISVSGFCEFIQWRIHQTDSNR